MENMIAEYDVNDCDALDYDYVVDRLEEALEVIRTDTEAFVFYGYPTWQKVRSCKIVGSYIEASDLLEMLVAGQEIIRVYAYDDRVEVVGIDHDGGTTWVIRPFASPKAGERVFANIDGKAVLAGTVTENIEYDVDDTWHVEAEIDNAEVMGYFGCNGHFDVEPVFRFEDLSERAWVLV